MTENEGMAIPGEGGDNGNGAADPVEEKARIQGWVPKEQFRGNPETWIDAKTFVERGDNIIPILKERNEHLAREMKETKESVKELTQFYKNAEERAYKRALQDIEQKKIAAVESADVDGYRAAEAEKTELEKTKPGAVQSPVQERPEMAAFRTANTWYDSEPELTAEADALGIAYSRQGMPYDKVLLKVQERIKILHPEKFSNARRDNASTVETVDSSTGLPKKAGAHTYENLPTDAKVQCDKWVAQGLLKKEDYVRDYEWA